MAIEAEIEIEARYANIDEFGNHCSIACIATFVNGKCDKVVVTDMKNIEDYVKRY